MTDDTHAAPPDDWAIVEMLGHRQLAGRIGEVTRYGTTLMRVDVPAGDGFVTQLIGGGSLYAVTLCTEEVARVAAARMSDPRIPEPAGFRPRAAVVNHNDWENGDGGPY